MSTLQIFPDSTDGHKTEGSLPEYDGRTEYGISNIESIDQAGLVDLGYTPTLTRNRTLATVLFQSLAIIAVPFGEGTALNSAIVGGGQLPYFVGWVMVSVLDMTVAMSLAEVCIHLQ